MLLVAYVPSVEIRDPAPRHGENVEVSKPDPEQTRPGELHMALIQPGDKAPNLMGQAGNSSRTRKSIEAPPDQMSEGVATEGVASEQSGIDEENEGSDSDSPLTFLLQRDEGIRVENENEHHRPVKSVSMEILEE